MFISIEVNQNISDIIIGMEALSIKNLTFSYDKENTILSDVSFSVEEGKYVSLLGHNGSGKSTLAKLLIGLLPFNQGEIYISGIQLNKDNLIKIRDKAAIVFQNPDNQFIGITVEDDIAFSLENRCISREEMIPLAKEYASKVGMEEFLNKEPAYLSGGQKQRVAIADALVIKPEILILDEATSMLDPKGKKEIFELIKEIKKNNPSLTIVSITHDVEEAYLSDEVIILEKGRIVASGNPKTLFSDKDLISKHHLSIPFEVELKDKIKSLGIEVKEDDSLESLGEKICRSR